MNYYFYWQASYQQINQLKCLLLRTIKFKPYRLCLRLETGGWGQRKEASWLVTTQSDQIKRQVLIILFFILKQLKRKVIYYKLDLGKQIADKCSSRHEGEVTTGALSRNIGKFFSELKLVPSSPFMKEPTEKPLKVLYNHFAHLGIPHSI